MKSVLKERRDRVFTMLAVLEWPTPVWREIEIRENQTLLLLHRAIQRAFQWYDDHLYAFFMSGREWDSDHSPVYSEPESLRQEGTDNPNERSADVKISELSVEVGQKIAYVYDFGDNLSVTVEVKAVSHAQSGIKYPRILALRGYSPEEYHYHIGYSKEIKKEIENGIPKEVKVTERNQDNILKQWSDSSSKW